METHYPHFPKPTMCQYCRQYTTTPHWQTKEIGKGTMQYAFCNEHHANLYYNEQFFGLGL